MTDPDPATTAAFSDPVENRRRRIEEEHQRLAGWDAAADNPAIAAAMAALNEHYHAEHHDAEDDDSIEACCVAVMLDAAGYVDTFDAYELGRAEARASECQRIRDGALSGGTFSIDGRKYYYVPVDLLDGAS